MPFDINTIADIVRPHHDKLIAEGKVAKLERENAKLREALLSCEEYFDDRADADIDYAGATPNTEMQLLSEVRAALLGGEPVMIEGILTSLVISIVILFVIARLEDRL